MQKKVGIRLRHLQGPPQQPKQQIIYKVEPPPVVDQNRKRQRSPSPLNRRKIFTNPYPEQRYQEPTQTIPPSQKIIKKPSTDNNRAPPMMMSPIMNQPLNSNNVSINDGNYQYQSEMERLIQSLKKKSLEVERKQEVITRLNKQIEYLTVQNRQYWQEIKTLKAQLEFERASYSTTQRSHLSQNEKIPKLPLNQPQPPITKPLKPTYTTNQIYEQQKSPIIHVKINQNKQQYREQEIKPKFSRIVEDRNREQDSILSDYLSPLMVLNGSNTKPVTPSYQNLGQRNYISKNSKSNSRVQYRPVEQAQEPAYSNIRNNTNYTRTQVQNPFAKKTESYSPPRPAPHQQQHQHSQPHTSDRYPYQMANNFHDIPSHKQRQFDREPERPRAWPTLQSSAAHFAQIPDNPHEYQQNRYNNNNNRRSNRQLAIEDSKQFRFEDFDFSELDNSNVHSQF